MSWVFRYSEDKGGEDPPSLLPNAVSLVKLPPLTASFALQMHLTWTSMQFSLYARRANGSVILNLSNVGRFALRAICNLGRCALHSRRLLFGLKSSLVRAGMIRDHLYSPIDEGALSG